jgi:tetratricopeptide (TPR) repeat protein
MNMSFMDRIESFFTANSQRMASGYLALLFSFMLFFLLSLAIGYSDTDLWYHLLGGSHLLEEGKLYNPYFNSYLTPQQPFINYFWGFQVIAYSVWTVGGEIGLIVLKSLLFLISAVFSARILLAGQPMKYASFLQLLAITAIVAILCARGFSVRPHLFSYAFIPIFIYILAYRPKYFPALPLLTILWVNIHGIEWVVGALLCGSFFIQRLVQYFAGDRANPDELKPLLWVVACLPAMMINPNGAYLLLTPFVYDGGIELFILELASYQIDFSIDLNNGLTVNTSILIIAALALLSVFACLKDYRQHIGIMLIACGGIVLLGNAKRFVWEWALLTTPLVGAGLLYWRGPTLNVRSMAFLVFVFGLLVTGTWSAMRDGWLHYPYNLHSLPYGTTQFIAKNNISGRYAVAPSYAGYVEFSLAPDIKIHMDMHFPPFTSLDIHEFLSATLTDEGLRTYVEKYQPTMIGVRKSNRSFPLQTAVGLGYVPVHFDSTIVLLLDHAQYPDIASRYALTAINPFKEDQVRRDELQKAADELQQMLSVVDTPGVKQTLVSLLIELGKFDLARLYIDELVAEKPGDLITVFFSARIEQLTENCESAVPAYEYAITRSDDPVPMHRFAAECYFLMAEHYDAYRHFKASIDPYTDKNPTALTYYQFALSAFASGEPEHARRLLKMIQHFDPDGELKSQVADLLVSIKTNPS